ncbi:hypothetical protein [Cognatazoarcus halotolerans]|uniref:hypothetical protein n=1 Tax=Cognatazoarcus halotolerans TaxID=2686016 RepID=UPI00135A1982|nr:hypothetical protein [Cognatazoarcus halotolerans]MCB1900610.1 hypothetical protein [Rhodocyclaceae bacterium]MCP5310539.1 hypothetical protein [Zoogloeaceae bacterium]
MKRTMWRGAMLAGAMLLAACGGGGGKDAALGGGNGPQPPGATAVGQSLGEASSTVIGAAGGSLASPDGRLSIQIPAGALTTDTTVSIEPISDMTRQGNGTAYRLSPHGENFALPVTLSFHYGAADVAGSSADQLMPLYQRADGIWQVAGTPTLDPQAGTVSVQTAHFSDWSLIARLLLSPPEAGVKVGESLRLRVLECVAPLVDDVDVHVLLPGCRPIDDDDYMLYGGDGWSVNGIKWGNGSVGLIDLVNAVSNTDLEYLAPDVKPDPAVVAVSVDFQHLGSSKRTTLVSNLTIIGDGRSYSGSARIRRSDLDATATINWNIADEQVDVSDYTGSGVLQGTLTMSGCAPLPFSIAVSAGSADSPATRMSVFNDLASPPYQNAYFFYVEPAEGATLTLECSGQSVTIPASTVAAWVDSRTCPSGGDLLYHTNPDHLSGSWSCAARDLGVDWDFVRE